MRRVLRAVLLLDSPDRALPACVWTGAAAISVAAAATIALRPGMLADLWEVRQWIAAWDFGAGDPYRVPQLRVDYLPHAFFVVWPLGLLPAAQAARWDIAINIALLAAAAWLFVGWIANEARAPLTALGQTALAGLFLSAGPVRHAIWQGQTQPLALLLAILAARQRRTRPALAAVCLGLAAFKPNLGLAFGLALLLTGSAGVVVAAVACGGALSLLFAATVDSAFPDIAARYVGSLTAIYGADPRFTGVTSIQLLLHTLIRQATIADWTYGMIAVLTLGYVTRMALRARHSALTIATCFSWSLAMLPNQRYNVVLLFPALWVLIFRDRRLFSSDRLREAAIAFLILCLAIDAPFVLRRVSDRLVASQAPNGWDGLAGALWDGSHYPWRVIVLCLFVVCLRALRGPRLDTPETRT